MKGTALMKRILLILALVATLFILPLTATAEASELTCPTEGWTETVTVPSARSPRLDATQTTTVVVTGIVEGRDQTEVHYKAVVVTHDAYAIGEDGRRGVTTTAVYDMTCIDRHPYEEPPRDDPGRDPVCGSDARCALIEAIYERHAAALDRP